MVKWSKPAFITGLHVGKNIFPRQSPLWFQNWVILTSIHSTFSTVGISIMNHAASNIVQPFPGNLWKNRIIPKYELTLVYLLTLDDVLFSSGLWFCDMLVMLWNGWKCSIQYKEKSYQHLIMVILYTILVIHGFVYPTFSLKFMKFCTISSTSKSK